MPPPDPFPQRLARAQNWLSAVGFSILIAGLAGSFWAYRRASNESTDASRELVASMQDNKVFQRNLEIQGGKANVVANDIGVWFIGLWQGRRLATTLAVLSVATALVCFLIAYFLPDFPPFPPPHEAQKKDEPANQPPAAP